MKSPAVLFLVALTAAPAVAACSSSSASQPAAPTAQPAPDTNDAGDSPREAGSTPVACMQPDGKLTVTKSSLELDPPRDHHVTFIRETTTGPYLYVVGGARDSFAEVFDDVVRSKIGEDGSLGPFEKVSTISGGVAGQGLAIIGNTVLLSGGTPRRVGMLASTWVNHLADDGSLGEWVHGPVVPQAVMHSAVVVDGKNAYVIGGTTGSAASPMVARTTLGDDGTFSSFERMTPLDPPRSHVTAFIANRSLYVVGGLSGDPNTNPPSRDDIIRADIKEDGSLGDWQDAGKLPMTLSVSSIQQVGCSFYIFGGLTDGPGGDPFTNIIMQAKVGDDGMVSVTKLAAKTSIKRGHVHQTPIYKNFIYSVGGRQSVQDLSTGTIDIGKFE